MIELRGVTNHGIFGKVRQMLSIIKVVHKNERVLFLDDMVVPNQVLVNAKFSVFTNETKTEKLKGAVRNPFNSDKISTHALGHRNAIRRARPTWPHCRDRSGRDGGGLVQVGAVIERDGAINQLFSRLQGGGFKAEKGRFIRSNHHRPLGSGGGKNVDANMRFIGHGVLLFLIYQHVTSQTSVDTDVNIALRNKLFNSKIVSHAVAQRCDDKRMGKRT